MKVFSFSKKYRRSLLYTVLLMALLGTGIYAWIFGDSAPSVNGSMKIGDTSGLVFQFVDEDGNVSDDAAVIDLNEYLGISTKKMVLNEVSSADAVNFVKRDTAQYYLESGNPSPKGNGEVLTFVEAVKNHKEPDEEEKLKFTGDYVHVDLNLKLTYAEENATYYIYFLEGSLGALTGYHTGFVRDPEGSLITDDGLRALRAGITVQGNTSYGPALQGENHIGIFGNVSESVADGLTQAVVSTETVKLRLTGLEDEYEANTAGTYYLDYLNKMPGTFGTVTEGMQVNAFSDFAVDGENGLNGPSLPNANYLFTLDRNCQSVQISLDLWLEGGSEFCQNADVFVNDNVQFNMYLVAYRVTEQ